MDELTRRFLNRYQGGFPVEEQPFARVGAELGVDAATIIDLIKQMNQDQLLSRFGPLYDAASMGGGLTLAALSVPDERFDEVAELVNEMPEVAHNYEREHALNMWFVLATEKTKSIQKAIDRIEQAVNLPVYNFPKLQTFYLGLWLHIDESDRVSTRPVPGPLKQAGMMIDDLDRCIVRLTQAGLPLRSAPYSEIAGGCGCDTQAVLHRVQRMLDSGVIRRIGAIPNHYRLGLRSNGMSVWNVDDDRLPELGARVGRLDFVSHCYERPRHLPTWPYNLFAMVHGPDRDAVNEKVTQIAELLGDDCGEHEVLFSKRILKKTGLRLVA